MVMCTFVGLNGNNWILMQEIDNVKNIKMLRTRNETNNK